MSRQLVVNSSVAIKKPIIAVSIKYRLGGWGFLGSKAIHAAGASNIGLFDQRLALQWINVNIRAFGDDPKKVTIAGEPAGGFSVGYYLVGFVGKNDGLFRAAIIQSGTALGPGLDTIDQLNSTYQTIHDNVSKTVDCSRAEYTAMLREAPFEKLQEAFAPFVMTPFIDGEFLSRLPSESFCTPMIRLSVVPLVRVRSDSPSKATSTSAEQP